MLTLAAEFAQAAAHAVLVLDRARVERYQSAIAASVRPDDVVVDVGSGSGLLALLAARAGARKVYAVEATGSAELIRAHARENGLEERIEIIRGDARDAVFATAPTLIITETMGSIAVDEGMLPIVRVVASKCQPDVRAIPASVEIVAAPVSDAELTASLDGLHDLAGLRLTQLRMRTASQVLPARVSVAQLCGPAAGTGPLVLPGASVPRPLRARLVVDRRAPVNAVALWFRAELAPGMELDTGPFSPPTTWPQLVLPIDPPLTCDPGTELELELYIRSEVNRSTWAWSLRCGDVIRKADGLESICADNIDDVLRQLGGQRTARWVPSENVTKLAYALRGQVRSLDEMADQLFAALPARYAAKDDARQDLIALFRRIK